MATTPLFNPQHVRDYVIRPVLAALSLPAPATAERLLMGTAAQESQFTHLKQIGGGPALGLWQMEPGTLFDLFDRFVSRQDRWEPIRGFLAADVFYPSGNRSVATALGLPPSRDFLAFSLQSNLPFACAMARLHYYARPFDMASLTPTALELANVWKQHYNTVLGKGKVTEFVDNYKRYVLPVY